MRAPESLAVSGRRLLVVSGPGGVGKGTVIAALALRRSDVAFSVSATTRAPRPDETDGVHYRFVNAERFAQMVAEDAFLEWAEFNGHRYGTPWSSVRLALESGRVVVLDIEMQGAEQVRARFPEAILVFLQPPSLEALVERLRARGADDAAAIERRMAIAQRQVSQESAAFDHIVLNDRVESAVDAISRIIDDIPV